MADTTRQKILNNIKTVLKTIPQIKTVLLNKLTISDLSTHPTPICFIFSGGENKEWDVINYETWKWPVSIEVWALDSDMEIFLGLIHNVMALDETRGGYAIRCERLGSSAPFLIDPENNLAGMLLDYQIWYRHLEGVA
jgi:hypothetical protein